ncbi:MAG: metallophosphoesterase family protein [Deltaproteobacteria bacterium]|nr:metallophosphoesterase family protein [Deltaproteobacteria bacterium]
MRYLCAFLLFSLWPLSSLFADIPYHVRITWHEDPAGKATISFSTDIRYRHVVLYLDRTEHGHEPMRYQQKLAPQWQQQYRGSSVWGYHVRVRDLSPDTTYFFYIQTGRKTSEIYHFRTAPADPRRAFRLIFAADSGSDHAARRSMNQRMREVMLAHPDTLALAHGGGYVEDSDSWKQWDRWLHDHSLTTASGRLLPVIPGQGESEAESLLFREIFDGPGHDSGWYLSKIGSLDLIHLNTGRSVSGDQKVWLQNLLLSEAKRRWIVASYSHPAWPAESDPGLARRHWVPLFERFRADLVFESGGHALKRTLPIRAGQRDDQDGVIYVGEGGAGARQRSPVYSDYWYLQEPGYVSSGQHIQILKVGWDRLDYRVVLRNGTVFDQITLQPRRHIPEGTEVLAGQQADTDVDLSGSFRIISSSQASCLQAGNDALEYSLWHKACRDTSEELFRAESSGTDPGLHLLRHQGTQLCIEFLREKAFMGMFGIVLSSCDPENEQQWVRFRETGDGLWQIASASEQHCLHFSNTSRTVNGELRAGLQECSADGIGRAKESFQIRPWDL